MKLINQMGENIMIKKVMLAMVACTFIAETSAMIQNQQEDGLNHMELQHVIDLQKKFKDLHDSVPLQEHALAAPIIPIPDALNIAFETFLNNCLPYEICHLFRFISHEQLGRLVLENIPHTQHNQTALNRLLTSTDRQIIIFHNVTPEYLGYKMRECMSVNSFTQFLLDNIPHTQLAQVMLNNVPHAQLAPILIHIPHVQLSLLLARDLLRYIPAEVISQLMKNPNGLNSTLPILEQHF